MFPSSSRIYSYSEWPDIMICPQIKNSYSLTCSAEKAFKLHSKENKADICLWCKISLNLCIGNLCMLLTVEVGIIRFVSISTHQVKLGMQSLKIINVQKASSSSRKMLIHNIFGIEIKEMGPWMADLFLMKRNYCYYFLLHPFPYIYFCYTI